MLYYKLQNCKIIRFFQWAALIMNKLQILPLLQGLKNNNLQAYNVEKLVEVSYKMAVTYLSVSYNKIHKILCECGLSIDDIAIETIAPLF